MLRVSKCTNGFSILTETFFTSDYVGAVQVYTMSGEMESTTRQILEPVDALDGYRISWTAAKKPRF